MTISVSNEVEDEQALAASPLRLQLVPHRHTKIVHLIRHGQGFHNVAGHADYSQYKSFDYIDSHLTDFGWHQASLTAYPSSYMRQAAASICPAASLLLANSMQHQ